MFNAWSSLNQKLVIANTELNSFYANQATSISANQFSNSEVFLLDGLISYIWQSWIDFCRECFMNSCMGCTTLSGTPLAATIGAISEAHVSSAAIKAKKSATPPFWGQQNLILRLEPTWGDVDVLTKITQRINPPNCSQILAALSSASQSLKVIQNIRNACAHRNHQTLQLVTGSMSSYIAKPTTDPVQSLFWIVPSNGKYLSTHVVDEMSATSFNCCS